MTAGETLHLPEQQRTANKAGQGDSPRNRTMRGNGVNHGSFPASD
jgi:hypothetical protein